MFTMSVWKALDLFERPPSVPHSAKLNDVIWHHRQQGKIGCKLPGYWFNDVSQIAWQKTFLFNKEKSRFRLENLRRACCSLSVFFKVLAARKTHLITARVARWLKFDYFQTWANSTEHVTTHRNTVAKRTQHVAPNNVAICCDRLAGALW